MKDADAINKANREFWAEQSQQSGKAIADYPERFKECVFEFSTKAYAQPLATLDDPAGETLKSVRRMKQAYSERQSRVGQNKKPRGDDTPRNRVIRLMRDARADGQNLRAFLENASEREFWDANGLRIDPIEGNGLPSRAARYRVAVDRGGEEEEGKPFAFETLRDWWKKAGEKSG